MLLAIVIMNNVALISALLKSAARINEIRISARDSIQYKQLGDERLGISQSKFSLVFDMRLHLKHHQPRGV